MQNCIHNFLRFSYNNCRLRIQLIFFLTTANLKFLELFLFTICCQFYCCSITDSVCGKEEMEFEEDRIAILKALGKYLKIKQILHKNSRHSRFMSFCFCCLLLYNNQVIFINTQKQDFVLFVLGIKQKITYKRTRFKK